MYRHQQLWLPFPSPWKIAMSRSEVEGRASSQERIPTTPIRTSRIYDGPWWPWIVLLIVVYGLLRRSMRSRRKADISTASNSTSFHDEPRTSSATRTRRVDARKKPPVPDSRRATEKSARRGYAGANSARERNRVEPERIANLTAFRRATEKKKPPVPDSRRATEKSVRRGYAGANSVRERNRVEPGTNRQPHRVPSRH